MRFDQDPDVGRWLEAESEARDDADARFRAMFVHHVRRLEAPAGLAARVMVHAARTVPVAVPLASPAWLAPAALVLLAVGGLTAAAFWSVWMPDLAAAVARLPRAVSLALTFGRLVAAPLGQAWSVAMALVNTVTLVATTAPGAAAIAANLTIAFGASLALGRLVAAPSMEEGE